jgi:conserved oligomeric Golgi complex subunit 8
VPELDEKALSFSQKYSKSNTENAVLDRRKKAILLSRNVDRVSDILELPTLLATAIASSSSASSSASASASTASSVNYSQALDLFAHIKRLQILHPESDLIQSVLGEAEEAMKDMTSNLIISLRSQNIRLAAAIRTIGWLKRVAPELAIQSLPSSSIKPAQGSTHSSSRSSVQSTADGSFGYLFLACRLYNLINMLEALAPLRDLADQETQHRLQKQDNPVVTSPSSDQFGNQRKLSSYSHSAFTGQQTERYLKRYIEIFREQSFATISMYKNIFPATTSDATTTSTKSNTKPITTPSTTPTTTPAFLAIPHPLATFPSHLISLLSTTLQQYLPNLSDPSARDSLLMQVLYAAGSLGRLGADFSMVLASLLDDDSDDDNEEGGEGETENAMVDDVQESDELDERTIEAAAVASAAIGEGNDNNENNDNDDDHDDNNENDDELPHLPQRRPKKTDHSVSPNSKLKLGQKAKPQIICSNNATPSPTPTPTPEWIRIMHKHRLQSSKLDALSSSSPSLPATSSSPQDAVVAK